MEWTDDKTSKVWAEILKHKFFIACQKDLYIEDMLTVTANKILELEQTLYAISDVLKVPVKQGAIPTIRKIRTILDESIISDKNRSEVGK